MVLTIDEGIQHFGELLCCHGTFHILPDGYAFRKLLQCQRYLSAATLGGMTCLIAVEGNTPGDLTEECGEGIGPVGRNGLPAGGVGVIHRFFGIFTIRQNVAGDGKTVAAIFSICFRYGIFTSLKIEFNDFLVIQE